jgi:hypothetical protein
MSAKGSTLPLTINSTTGERESLVWTTTDSRMSRPP